MSYIIKNAPMHELKHVNARSFGARFAHKLHLCIAVIQLTAGPIRGHVCTYTLCCRTTHKYTRGDSAAIRAAIRRPFCAQTTPMYSYHTADCRSHTLSSMCLYLMLSNYTQVYARQFGGHLRGHSRGQLRGHLRGHSTTRVN